MTSKLESVREPSLEGHHDYYRCNKEIDILVNNAGPLVRHVPPSSARRRGSRGSGPSSPRRRGSKGFPSRAGGDLKRSTPSSPRRRRDPGGKPGSYGLTVRRGFHRCVQRQDVGLEVSALV